jgi:hypothetical protein
MDALIPETGFPPGESAEDFVQPAPHKGVGEPPPLVLEARRRGLDI